MQAYPTPAYTYEYDAYGNETAIVDPKGSRTEFTFDEQGRQLTRTLPIGVNTTDDLNDPMESMTYIDGGIHDGMLERSIDFEGRVTDYTYDNRGRLLT